MPFEHHHLTPTYPPKSTRPMETIGFVSTLRQQALLLGDYNAYRQMCSRRLAKLRKRLGRVNDPRKKDQRPAPVRAEDIAKDPTCVFTPTYPLFDCHAYLQSVPEKT